MSSPWRLLGALLLLVGLGCGEPGVVQVGPTLPDVTEDGRLEVEGRVMNVLDLPLEVVTVTMTVLHVSGATYVESVDVVRDGDDPLSSFESISFHIESSVPIEDVLDFALSFDAP